MELDELKKEYSKLEKKYSLPKFKELEENFEIGKLDKETDTLLRSIRKVMIEKIINSINFIEMLLNPMNAPRMYFNYIRSMNSEDKNTIEKIYTILSGISLISLEREIDYSEKGEADLIKAILKSWNDVKPEFRKIVERIKSPNLTVVRKERNYFG